MLRYKKCTDPEILSRLYEILAKEKITKFDDSGMKTILFTCNGDMRQAINTMESCWHGFGEISEEKVLKIVDEPHPLIVKRMVDYCAKGQLSSALTTLNELWKKGYAAEDIIGQIQRILRVHDNLEEDLQLGFMNSCSLTHLRISSGCNSSVLQLSGLLSTFVALVDSWLNKIVCAEKSISVTIVADGV